MTVSWNHGVLLQIKEEDEGEGKGKDSRGRGGEWERCAAHNLSLPSP
jgi:hypothetical protein